MAVVAHKAAIAVAVGGGVLTASSGANNGLSSSQSAGSSKSSSLVARQCLTPPALRLGFPVERKPMPTFNTGATFQPVACASSVSVNEAVVENNVGSTKLGGPPASEKETLAETVDNHTDAPSSQASISAFMTDVTNLVKLVDSKDIVELELKFSDYEIVIRKEAAQQPPAPPTPSMTFPGPHVMAHTSMPMYAPPPPVPPVLPPALPSAEPASVPIEAPAPPVQPSHPPMLSPMAGTFYRSPGPGLKAFVQVGDKVTKGQVVCIVEAMKLMNEIEADQSGTILEISAEDGKPISIEQPLFVIKP